MYEPQKELVTIVDANNHVTGAATRAAMRRDNLYHRATYVFVFDSAGLLYVQLRTLIKDVYPGYYDLAAGGVVLANESYKESATRELAEELGVHDVRLEHWFEFYFEDPGSRVFGSAFSCVYDGAMTLQPEEVQSVDRMRVEDVLSPTPSRSFTPDTLFALRRRIVNNK